MATNIEENVFKGPNQGIEGGYIPNTEIISDPVDLDFSDVLHDLNYHLSLLQIGFDKLDKIDLDLIKPLIAIDIYNALYGSEIRIDETNIDIDIPRKSDVEAMIEAHRIATAQNKMHPEISVRSTDLVYSATPTALITSCNNLLDEINNIRYQVHRIIGDNFWSDTPAETISNLKINSDILSGYINDHIGDSTLHITPDYRAAMDAAESPSGTNAFATVSQLGGKGVGDMQKCVYDKNNNGVVDKAEALTDGDCGVKTYADIKNKIANDIASHHHSCQHSTHSDDDICNVVHSDLTHSPSTVHDYNDLINKPAPSPADSLTEIQVNNIKADKLVSGTSPWDDKAPLNNGVVTVNYLQSVKVLTTSWTDTVKTKSYHSATTAGEVSDSIVGPAYIYCGTGFKTTDFGVLQVNTGNGWQDVAVSYDILGSLTGNPGQHVWMCPPLYIPTGKTFQIKAGSIYTGSGTAQNGGGYYIQYKSLL
jgi:hypothetical protein